MLEVYKRDEHNGKLKVLASFNSFDEFFNYAGHYYDFTKYFGYTDTARHPNSAAGFGDHHRTPVVPLRTDEIAWYKESHYCYVLFENDKLVTPDRIVGLYREFKYNRRKDRPYRYWWTRKSDRGQKKDVYGHIRKMRTTQEKRWANAWDDEEFAPHIRPKRSVRLLPDAWDDYWAHNQKSWKRQSKRRHQWKEK